MSEPTKAPAQLPWPEPDHGEFGAVETAALSRIQQITAQVMARNWASIPHVTHHDEIDVTALEAARKKWNAAHPDAKRTLLPAVAKALTRTLKEHPQFNASLSADLKTLTLKRYFHIGVAVDTPQGLLVGVVRDCDQKSIGQIADEIAALSEKARTKGLPMSDMAGGCMTISSIGHIGGTGFTPIINAPEVAILGLCRLALRAVPDAAGGIAWASVLPVSLSYDHRVINGAAAAAFVRSLAAALGEGSFD